MAYLLRIEAVNFDHFLSDAADLSTVRGGSLLLLDAVERIEENFGDRLAPVSRGASSGLFQVAEPADRAPDLVRWVRDFLSADPQLRHATFVVNAAPLTEQGDAFQPAANQVEAENRWAQWKQPTLVVPEINTDSERTPCDIDRLRPGVEPGPLKDNPDGTKRETFLSASVYARREYGRNQKQKFYRRQLERYGHSMAPGFGFVKEFETLARDPERPILDGKMAVIYLDGNRFGSIQRDECPERKNLEEFDRTVKESRAAALNDLLGAMTADSGYQTFSKEGEGEPRSRFRLETLLWGGDELIWVVPAWRGWDALRRFYGSMGKIAFRGKTLTHAGGLVFCHYNAPIHGIVDLCRTLAEAAKADDRETNLFQYMVLESFDAIGQGLDEYRKRQFPGYLMDTPCSVNAAGMAALAGKIRALKSAEFPKGRVYQLAEAAVLAAEREEPERYDRRVRRLVQTLPGELQAHLAELQQPGGFLFPDVPDAAGGIWIHLAELWDYACPEEPDV